MGLAGYALERSYGFATLGPALWLLDRGRGYLFGLLTIPAVWLGYLLLEKSPRRWWLWLWLASLPWLVFFTLIYPVFIAPAYNRFEPLRDTSLRQALLEEAKQAGIRGAQVYVVNSSSRSTKLNAYVDGIGATKRIVLYDTTLKTLPRDQILAVVGHEMGHYALGHVWWLTGASAAEGFVLLWLLSRLLPWAVRRFGPRLGIPSLADFASLPLALLILSLLLFLQTPAQAAFSRYLEHQADRFGLELTHLNVPMARAFVAFYSHDYADPDPPRFLVYWFYSHPPLRERIAFALSCPADSPRR